MAVKIVNMKFQTGPNKSIVTDQCLPGARGWVRIHERVFRNPAKRQKLGLFYDVLYTSARILTYRDSKLHDNPTRWECCPHFSEEKTRAQGKRLAHGHTAVTVHRATTHASPLTAEPVQSHQHAGMVCESSGGPLRSSLEINMFYCCCF